jgi:hypothetical protein
VTIPEFSASGGNRPPDSSHLLSPLYLAALAGLLLNDFVLKSAPPALSPQALRFFRPVRFCGVLVGAAARLHSFNSRCDGAWLSSFGSRRHPRF